MLTFLVSYQTSPGRTAQRVLAEQRVKSQIEDFEESLIIANKFWNHLELVGIQKNQFRKHIIFF